MTKEEDVTCPLHHDFKERIMRIEECVDAIKDSALKSSKWAALTLLSIIIGILGFFGSQVYFKIHEPAMSSVQLEQVLTKALEKVKK